MRFARRVRIIGPMKMIDAETARMIEGVCDAIVPGSARVRPAVYVDAKLALMPEGVRAAALAAFAAVAEGDIAALVHTPDFLWVRALAIEAFYSDFVAPGVDATGAWAEIDFNTPLATRLAKDWSYLGIGMSARFDVVVVGSGAGGGIVAGELAERGRRVLLLECGPHLTAADFTRWEAKATHDLFWPTASPMTAAPAARSRCWAAAASAARRPSTRRWRCARTPGISSSGTRRRARRRRGRPFGESDLAPHYDRVEARLGVRERNDWPRSVLRSHRPSRRSARSSSRCSYTDGNCMRCGSCLQGCPTNAGKSTLNTYIHDAWAAGKLELSANAHVERVVIENGEAKGVEYTNGDGALTRSTPDVVAAGGTLDTPQLLLRSALPDSASSRLVGRNLGFHPARLVYGLFDEPQDAHMVYPITAHAMGLQHDEDGGFVVEATTIQDPIGFATTLEDENGPLWGARSSRR